jgi:hypothetical protein
MSTLLTPATLEDIKPPVMNNKKASTDFKRTQKHYDTKISNVLKSLQEMDDNDDDDAHTLGDFIPPPKPISMGSEKKEDSNNEPNKIKSTVYSKDGLELNNLKYTYPNETKIDNYYKNYVPNYTPQSNIPVENQNHIQNYKPKYIPNNISSSNNTQLPISYNNTYSDPNILLEKLNYMIHLLEDKNDMKTKSTFEEILLYCFLGIFTIFLVDSFSRVGKYIR